MNINLRKATEAAGKRGSYITEAVLTLPVLVIAVCALALLIRITAVCENICFGVSQGMREITLEAPKNIETVSLCKKIENRVLREEDSLTHFAATNMRRGYSQNGIKDLMTVGTKAEFKVVNVVGIKGRIDFELKLTARAFTGAERASATLSAEDFNAGGASCEVVVFPKYGIRFHKGNCRYKKMYEERGSYALAMEREEAMRKGYTACKLCGGTTDA